MAGRPKNQFRPEPLGPPVTDNQAKPESRSCPKCAGHYHWEGENSRCMNCGFVYNPVIPPRKVFVYCTYSSCNRKLDQAISVVYCPHHVEQIRKRCGVRQENIRGIPTGPKEMGTFRHNFPLRMALRRDPGEE